MDDLISNAEDNKRDMITNPRTNSASTNKNTRGSRISQSSSSGDHHQRVIHGTSRNINLYHSRGNSHRQPPERYTSTTTNNISNSRGDPTRHHHHTRHHRQIPANVIPVLNHKLSERSTSSDHHRSNINLKDLHHQSTSSPSTTARYNQISSSRTNDYSDVRSVDQQQQQQQQQQRLNTTADDFDIFGRYVASKMRKLRYKLSEEEMEELEFDILNTMERKRFNAAATSRQASSAIQQSSLSLSVSRKRDYPIQQPDVPDVHELQDRDGHDLPPIPVVIPETGECQETEDDDVESTTLVEVDDNDHDAEAEYEQQQQRSPPNS